MATLTLKTDKTPTTIWCERVAYNRPSRDGREYSDVERRTAFTHLIDNNGWTLAEYITWINRPEEGVIKGELMPAEHWTEMLGYTTAAELGAHLDAEFQRELRKSQY